jgi:hypothetical protein
MRTILGLDARSADAGSPPANSRRAVTELKPVARSVKSAKAREQKLGATARSFAILEHVAKARMNVQTARRHLPTLRRTATELAEIFQDNS